MKVSVIIPVYNVENFVIECLDSIKQLQFEYEIIVVNDGRRYDWVRNLSFSSVFINSTSFSRSPGKGVLLVMFWKIVTCFISQSYEKGLKWRFP